MTCSRCGYEWEPRVENPKCCPMCKRYLGAGRALVPQSTEPLPVVTGTDRLIVNTPGKLGRKGLL